MSEPSWRTVADELAARLMHNARCEAHDDPHEADDCPFCQDARAYLLYVRKGGTVRPHSAVGPSVRIEDVPFDPRPGSPDGLG